MEEQKEIQEIWTKIRPFVDGQTTAVISDLVANLIKVPYYQGMMESGIPQEKFKVFFFQYLFEKIAAAIVEVDEILEEEKK